MKEKQRFFGEKGNKKKWCKSVTFVTLRKQRKKDDVALKALECHIIIVDYSFVN